MYKHSHIKREDGDHINIWVNRRFVDSIENPQDTERDLDKRQSLRLAENVIFRPGTSPQWCDSPERYDTTGSDSPFTGGLNAMLQWADTNSGSFYVRTGYEWWNMVVAGSNSGANALYRVHRIDYMGQEFYLGTDDFRKDVSWTGDRQRQYGSSWRASSTGQGTCTFGKLRYELTRTQYDA